MAHILIAYATRTGSTAEVAAILGDELHRLGHDTEVAAVASAPWPSGYDFVVIGSGVRVRRFYGEAVDYVAEHERELAGLPVALFDVSLAPVVEGEAGRERGHATIERLLERFPVIRPVATAAFSGAFVPDRLNAREEELVRLMGAQPGDYVDEAEVRHWAHTLAAAVPRPARIRG